MLHVHLEHIGGAIAMKAYHVGIQFEQGQTAFYRASFSDGRLGWDFESWSEMNPLGLEVAHEARLACTGFGCSCTEYESMKLSRKCSWSTAKARENSVRGNKLVRAMHAMAGYLEAIFWQVKAAPTQFCVHIPHQVPVRLLGDSLFPNTAVRTILTHECSHPALQLQTRVVARDEIRTDKNALRKTNPSIGDTVPSPKAEGL